MRILQQLLKLSLNNPIDFRLSLASDFFQQYFRRLLTLGTVKG
jgi:hypothetical protein